MIIITASLVLVAFVLELRRVPYGRCVVIAMMAIYVLWPVLRYLAAGDGMWFLVGAAFGPFAYKAHVGKLEAARADAARRRAMREQYREIGL